MVTILGLFLQFVLVICNVKFHKMQVRIDQKHEISNAIFLHGPVFNNQEQFSSCIYFVNLPWFKFLGEAVIEKNK